MAKANTLTKILLPTALVAAVAYGFKKFSDQKNAFKLLRIGVAAANKFKFRLETASVEFELTLLMQNLGSLSVSVQDFVGKAFVNGKELGFVNTMKPIVIQPKSESKQTIYLSIPVLSLVQVAGMSMALITKKQGKVLSHAIKFEGLATLAGGVEVPVDQTINI